LLPGLRRPAVTSGVPPHPQLPTGDAAPARADAEHLDARDPLARFAERFQAPGPGDSTIYLCGNSLGLAPRTALAGVSRATSRWAEVGVRGWDEWLDLPRRLGDRLATPILGARPGEVVLSDSTSVNLYKLAAAARAARPGRSVIVASAGDFPTDRYILEGLGRCRMIAADPVSGPTVEAVSEALDDDTALVCLSHIDYRSSAVADMAAIGAAAHRAGALTLWDLSHSAGCYPVQLQDCEADLAVGCTYKYLCSGPGAPAFLYVRAGLQDRLRQPIWGWFGQRDQFAMADDYDPAPGMERFLVGTPPVLALAAVDAALDVVVDAGVAAIRAKAVALGTLAVQLTRAWLAPLGFALASPNSAASRGSHLALSHPDARRVHRDLLHRAAVVTDFRVPDLIRIGMSPLTTRFVDVWDAWDRLRALSY
jgi:kynureninase